MYDKKNLESIEKAIADRQAGRRVVGVSYGDTRLQYANITLDELIKLRNRVKAGLADPAKTKKRQVIFTTSKGVS